MNQLKLRNQLKQFKRNRCKGKQLFMPIRVAVTGQTHGPELPNTIALLGRDKVLSRLKRII